MLTRASYSIRQVVNLRCYYCSLRILSLVYQTENGLFLSCSEELKREEGKLKKEKWVMTRNTLLLLLLLPIVLHLLFLCLFFLSSLAISVSVSFFVLERKSLPLMLCNQKQSLSAFFLFFFRLCLHLLSLSVSSLFLESLLFSENAKSGAKAIVSVGFR